MSTLASDWIRDFLKSEGRNLENPDGRPMYAYRCSGNEFEALGKTLEKSSPCAGLVNDMVARAFTFYAAEWWQRRYDGRHWAWEPLLSSIGWNSVDYPDLYEPVRKAWRWWRIDLVRLPTSIRYLGTFACQGGLPLAMVRDTNSRVTHYLRAVLKHTAAYRQCVADPIDLARDQQHLLHPPTLRRDYVFQLAADLIESVLDFQADAQDENPLNALDQAQPDWRNKMPLDLGDERARDLLTGLLREAAQGQASPVNDFRVERFLRETGVGWRLGARVRLPGSIPVDNLSHQLGVKEAVLPSRIEVRTQNERIIGLYSAQSGQFQLAQNRQTPDEFWDSEAAGEIRLRFLSKELIGAPLVPNRGSALSDLPWVFQNGNDGLLIGEGSVSSRLPEIIVLAPYGVIPDRLDTLKEQSSKQDEAFANEPEVQVYNLERVLWKISQPVAFETTSGRCVVRPSSAQTAEQDYRLSGRRCYDFESAFPLFHGTPKLRVARGEQTARAVPANEVQWRQTGGDWRGHPDGFGLWDVRHVHRNELLYLGRAGILPPKMRACIEPGSELSQGHLLLHDADAVRVAEYDEEVAIAMQIEDRTVRVVVTAKNTITPPARLRLRLHWPGATELIIQTPFPGSGARILQDGKPVNRALVVDDLYGVRAVALSPEASQRFFIEGELKAPDLAELSRVAYFRRALVKTGVQHELPISDLRPLIELLLAGSSSSEASVTLRVIDRFQNECGAIHVNRFAANLEYDPSMSFLSLAAGLQDKTPITFHALELTRPELDPVQLQNIGPADAPQGAVLPEDLNLEESRLLVVGRNDRIRIQPLAIGGKPDPSSSFVGVRDTEVPYLQEALNLSDVDSRMLAIGQAMDLMLKPDDMKHGEDEWAFLTDSLLAVDGLPATAVDLLKVLVTKPRLLVRCLFRLEKATRNLLWRIEEELPFSWLLIRREIWWTEVKLALEGLSEQLFEALGDEHEQVAHEHITSILNEGADRISALSTISTDVTLRLKGERLGEDIGNIFLMEWDQQTPGQICLRSNLDDWPRGYGRNEWQEELGSKIPESLWQNEHECRNHQPIFDTPIAAAWCCFVAKPTHKATFLIKNIRAHDPEWFDLAYSTAWFRIAHAADNNRDRR